MTITAWIFIGLSAASTLMSALQNVVLSFAFSPASGFPIQEAQRHMPPAFAFLFAHMRVYFLAILLLSVATLVVSIGLLRRRGWARITFMGLLVFGILWNIGGVVAQQWLFPAILDPGWPQNAPPQFVAMQQGMVVAVRVVSAIFALGISVLFAWIIHKLRSPAIAAQFG